MIIRLFIFNEPTLHL